MVVIHNPQVSRRVFSAELDEDDEARNNTARTERARLRRLLDCAAVPEVVLSVEVRRADSELTAMLLVLEVTKRSMGDELDWQATGVRVQ